MTTQSAPKIKKSKGKLTGPKYPWLVHGILILVSVVMLFPLVWLLSTSLKGNQQAMMIPPVWIPHPILWSNYPHAITYESKQLGYIPFLVYGRNTLIIAILTVSGTVFSNSLVAYAFARLKWPGRNLLFTLTLATMMIPFPVLMVPTFILFEKLHWIGTFRPLWVPAWFGGAFNIFLLRQFLMTIPQELSEAAKMDGCSEWTIYRDIIMPLAKPSLAVVALFTFMGVWNDFLGPLIYLTNQNTFTLSLGLASYSSQNGGTDYGLLMAASTLIVAPIIILFFFTQKLLVQGIAVTGLKG